MPKRDGAPFDPRRLQDRRRPADVVSNVVNPRAAARGNGETHIRVVGIGGAGNNAINRMVDAGVAGVEFIAVNSDAAGPGGTAWRATRSRSGRRRLTAWGRGGIRRLGERATFESSAEIESALSGADMVFVTAGMGGGTGTGGAPIVARIAKDSGALTVGVVTMPFMFEGSMRGRSAEAGLEELREHVDALVVIQKQSPGAYRAEEHEHGGCVQSSGHDAC